VFGADQPAGWLDAWIGTLAFGGQIFCDFAGYSTAAIGVALCLGFAMPDNFRFPYAAIGFADFWRRWHISLSTWLRDYLYIPLGGNRHGSARTALALMLTMLLGGLWHGANWTFVVWGGLHGLFLVAERALRWRYAGYRPCVLASFGLGVLTWLLVNIAWVFFRADSLERAGSLLNGMLGLNAEAPPLLAGAHLLSVALIVGAIVGVHAWMRSRTLEAMLARVPPAALAIVWGLMAFAIIIEQGNGDAFIYFQF
jgi:alginate O-acetyltransferase complex protein AlgI